MRPSIRQASSKRRVNRRSRSGGVGRASRVAANSSRQRAVVSSVVNTWSQARSAAAIPKALRSSSASSMTACARPANGPSGRRPASSAAMASPRSTPRPARMTKTWRRPPARAKPSSGMTRSVRAGWYGPATGNQRQTQGMRSPVVRSINQAGLSSLTVDAGPAGQSPSSGSASNCRTSPAVSGAPMRSAASAIKSRSGPLASGLGKPSIRCGEPGGQAMSLG